MLKRSILMIGALMAITVAPASGGDSRPGPLGRHPWKQRQCIADCRTQTTQCLRDAGDTAAPCYEACAPLVEAARSACASDPTNAACAAAREAARACLDPCNAAFRPAARACIADGRECVRACPFIGEPPCLADCRANNVHCITDVRQTYGQCRNGCDDEVAALRRACATDPKSAECTAAQQALRTCLEPCIHAATDGLQSCGETLGGCIDQCGSATPTP